MVYRIYVEKKEGLAHEANGLLKDIRSGWLKPEAPTT